MTYRSESRGIMYTAPPSGDDDTDVRSGGTTDDAPEAPRDETPEPEAAEVDPEREAAENAERETPTLEPTTATTDANWTGTVPADD